MSVTLHGVGHRFARTDWLFRSVDAQFAAGTTTAVTGPSGSGKSTLLAILAGALSPTEGDVDNGDGLSVGWVFQNPFGVPHRSALDHVALPLLAQGETCRDAEAEALAIMDMFGLAEVADRLFGQLSGGEAQRLMLARAVASKPDILLVDEPTAQLDQHAAKVVAHVLASLASSGAAVAVATHDPMARDACDTIIDLGNYASDKYSD